MITNRRVKALELTRETGHVKVAEQKCTSAHIEAICIVFAHDPHIREKGRREGYASHDAIVGRTFLSLIGISCRGFESPDGGYGKMLGCHAINTCILTTSMVGVDVVGCNDQGRPIIAFFQRAQTD